jgi:hypothetical protein
VFSALLRTKISRSCAHTTAKFFFYYTTIQVGTPARNYTVIVDTGSADLLIPSVDCHTCVGNPKTFYNEKRSSTFEPQSCKDTNLKCTSCRDNGQCAYKVSYVGISESAVVVNDVVRVGDATVRAAVGAVYHIDQPQNALANRFNKRFGSRFGSHVAAAAAAAVADGGLVYPEGMWGTSAHR